MRLEAIGPAGRPRGGVVMIYWFRRPRFYLLHHPYARARARPWSARCYGSFANAIGRAKTAEGSRACFSPAFRARAWCRRIWRGVIMIYWFRRRDAARGDRAGWAVPRRVVMIYWFRRPRFYPFYHPYARARARPWSARCYGVARQRDRSRQNSTGVSGVLLSGISGSRVVPKNLARRKRKTRAIANQSPLLKLSEESDSKERLRVSNWIVQRLYNYAVKKTVEL